MPGTSKEWFAQSKYDQETALAMFKAGRYIYVVFICHLALEKALKGLHIAINDQQPPKTHNLIQLVKLARPVLSEEQRAFLGFINNLSIVTRYPDDLLEATKEFNRDVAKECLKKTEGVLKCLWKDPRLNRL